MSNEELGPVLAKAYEPALVEKRLYTWWEESGFFQPIVDPSQAPFTIVMPPPNVTGELHLGHALTAAIQDALIRYNRMMGVPTLWIPGADHAGIATQMVVERNLREQGMDRHDMGREAFLEEVWKWVNRYAGIIDNQHRRLGASCDWTKKVFTLDAGPSHAVRTTFYNLYKKQLIYRGERIINWCPSCQTALSDLEVNHREQEGHLYYIRYPLEGADGYVTVATTRPETLLGDTGIAVHPKDERYRSPLYANASLPVLGRTLPIIKDEAVDPSFGTGALKVTPGHDPNDYELGNRHNLKIINIMNKDGSLNAEAGPYAGLDRYTARAKLLEQLEQEGLLEKIEPITHSVGHCQRSDDVVEPILSKQWFVNIAPMAEKAIQAIEDSRVQLIPDRFTKVYLNWMNNIRDWCISRQLWWGHRIPVWYCKDCDHQTVSIIDPQSCEGCGRDDLTQDDDVLDTWFSSGLWPHSTLGWPYHTEDLDYFYPTSVLETGYDILFFWVARMIMLGLENMDDVPFRTVYLHGLVKDSAGVKMSKTKGNVMDPLQAIDKYGADALRFALSTGSAPGNDTRLSEAKLDAARNFANKLWNSTRYFISTVERGSLVEGWLAQPSSKHRHDRWILGRLTQVTQQCDRLWNEWQLGEIQRLLHDFLWGDVCDWYIEFAKIRIRGGDKSSTPVLAHVLERSFRLLHPFMPFLTEELWQTLRTYLADPSGLPQTIMLAPYPKPNKTTPDSEASGEVMFLTQVIRSLRNVRAEFHVDAKQFLTVFIEGGDQEVLLKEEMATIQGLAKVKDVVLASENPQPKRTEPNMITFVVEHCKVRIPMGSVIDVAQERDRLSSELATSVAFSATIQAKLSDLDFLQKAPEEVVERDRSRLSDLESRQSQLKELLTQMIE